MFGSEYQLSNDNKMMVSMDDKRKKPILYVKTGQASYWEKVALFDNHEALGLFLDAFSACKPEWLGKTYDEVLAEKFPFLKKG